MQHSDFVHLHLHTQYSLLDGAIRPQALFDLAHEYRMPAVAMTDHGNLFGCVEFYRGAMSSGIKPIIGCEVYVAPGPRTEKLPPSRGGSPEASYHLVLLVKDEIGYKNLCKMLTLAYSEGFYYRPRVDKELLSRHNEGLIAMSACLHGEIPFHIAAGRADKAEEVAAFYKGVFDERRFFLELQENGIEVQKKVNTALIEMGKKLDIPLVATNDCHYLRREEARFHDILLCVQTGKTVNMTERMRFQGDEFYFKSPQEMKEAFAHVPDATKNTVEIAERCNLDMKFGEPHLPDFPVPEGQTLDSYLDSKGIAGLEEKLKGIGAGGTDLEPVKIQYYDRLKKELDVIKGMGFSGYFLIVSDFIEYAKRSNIPVGPGRGSAAGSLVAYCLGITNLDPIRYNLLFERFLNPDRVSLPDIDIDFCIEGRDEVIKYVTDKYGQENVTQIITFGQMKARAVIRDVGRALDMPYGEVDKIAKLVPNQLNITIERALSEEPELRKLVKNDPGVGELIEAASALEGLPRHASTHAAGVVISNKPLVEYLPLYKGQKDDVITTQYSMNDVEKIGLVKFDFLGLKTLTVIDRAVHLIKDNCGDTLCVDTLPIDDSRTYALIAAGDTNGVFQLESSGMKELLRKLRPTDFEDLMAAVALYRPGPLQSGMVDDFIKGKHGKTTTRYELPELKVILEPTNGVIVYQEQVMEIARALAGFAPGDADLLRKAMGKKLPEQMLEQRTKFMDGARIKGIPERKAERIFDLMAHFAGYGFNKSHSAAYALIAFQTAYLKAHYPAEFMAALLSSDMNDTDKVIKYMNECRGMGVEVLPPHLNESAMDFAISGREIRFGLGAVKNVGSAAIETILKVRRECPFVDMLDFLSRVDSRKVNRKVVESLIKCGAFDFVDMGRARLLASLDVSMDAAQAMQRDRLTGQESMFDAFQGAREEGAPGTSSVLLLNFQDVQEWTEAERLGFEKEAIGVYITAHPLTSYVERMELVATDTTETLRKRRSNEEVTIGAVITQVREINTKKGGRMAIIRVEDLKGSVEVVVFSKLYKEVFPDIAVDQVVVIRGRVEKDEDTLKLRAQAVVPFDRAPEIRVKKTHIIAQAGGLGAGPFSALKKVLEGCPGTSPVFLHLVYPDDSETVLALPDELKVSPGDEVCSGIKDALTGAQVKIR